MMQRPTSHRGTALANGPQRAPHAPQLFSLVVRLVPHARDDAGQLANPGEQTTPHAPLVHVAISEPIHGHRRPRPPQLLTSSPRGLVSQPLALLLSQSRNPRAHAMTSAGTSVGAT